LSAGYTLGLLGDWQQLRPSLTRFVTASVDNGDTGMNDELGSIDSGTREVEASRFDNSARASVSTQVAVEPSERTQVERLMQLMGQSEATWAEGYKAERERADGIARDLASVRAELTARVAAETAVRAENARMAKLLKARKAEGTKKLAAEQRKSESTAKDSSIVAKRTDGAAADASPRAKTSRQQTSTPGRQ
jgi:hypothetical protein